MNTYICKKLTQAISIDGIYNKPVWDNIEEVFLVDTMTCEKPKLKTTVKAAWDDNYLYVAFYCEDNSINAKMTEYNDEIYKEEVVEVFLDDNCDLKTYIEIELSPLNTLLHYAAYNSLEGNILLYARKDKKVLTAIAHDAASSSWSAELAIPFSEFVTAPNTPPKEEDRWLVNFYRIKRPVNGEDEFSAWSPTIVRRYHTPSKFGEIVFVK